jgi:hypothetical protein
MFISVWGKNDYNKDLQTSYECTRVFLVSLEVIDIHITDIYCYLVLVTEAYKTN